MSVNPVVVIPFYKAKLNKYEQISVTSVIDSLGGYAVSLLVPERLSANIDSILRLNGLVLPNRSVHVVCDVHLSSHISYNQFMLNPLFYRYYKDYSHILIAQFDAYVFRDDLLHWCSTDYDYIGAPMNYMPAFLGSGQMRISGVGGFSLRKTDSFINALDENPQLLMPIDYWNILQGFNSMGKAFKSFPYFINYALKRNHLCSSSNALASVCGINEDVIFGYYLPRIRPSFRVPSLDEASLFCLDGDVIKSLSISNNHLPFGAHSWWTNQDNLKAWIACVPGLIV